MLKTGTSKFKNSKCIFGRTIGKKIQDRFENFWLRFVGVAFWNLPKTQKKLLKFQFSNLKNPIHSFVMTIKKKILEKFENLQLRFVGGVAF